jgi:predicted phage terminase large subunit-like protein
VNLTLTPWQEEVYADEHRFKVVAAGRRCGKSRLAAVKLIAYAMNGKPGKVFYVAPTQGMARDIMWDVIFELASDIIIGHNVNNMTITLAGNNTIYLKGADRPDTLRGVSLKYLVLDEYAFMKKDVWETILRPALSDMKGEALFIGTPEGRNHFYDMYIMGAAQANDLIQHAEYKSWTFTSYDNPFLDESEIEAAKESLPGWAFRQEYLASFDARGSEFFDVEEFEYYEEKPKTVVGDYYIAIDLAGFETDVRAKTKRRDNSAMAIVLVDGEGNWWVEELKYGRWTLDETVREIFEAVQRYKPIAVGVEKGIAQQAVMSPLQDMMRSRHKTFRIDLLTHGNKRKEDRILWALQGRFEHKKIKLKRDKEWNATFVDEASAFPSKLVHDDLLDALAYIDQMAIVPYFEPEEHDYYEPLDATAGY